MSCVGPSVIVWCFKSQDVSTELQCPKETSCCTIFSSHPSSTSAVHGHGLYNKYFCDNFTVRLVSQYYKPKQLSSSHI